MMMGTCPKFAITRSPRRKVSLAALTFESGLAAAGKSLGLVSTESRCVANVYRKKTRRGKTGQEAEQLLPRMTRMDRGERQGEAKRGAEMS